MRIVETKWPVRSRTPASSAGTHGRGGGIRTRDPLHPMQVRYQAALRPEGRDYIRATLVAAQKLANRLDFLAHRNRVQRFGVPAAPVGTAHGFARRALVLVEPVARTVDRE